MSFAHTLLRDALALSLLGFAGFMTLEGLIPGFVSEHLNLAKVILVIALLMAALIATATMRDKKKSLPDEEATNTKRASRWLLAVLIPWASVLLVNSLIKFPPYSIGIIFVSTAIIGILLYAELFDTERKA